MSLSYYQNKEKIVGIPGIKAQDFLNSFSDVMYYVKDVSIPFHNIEIQFTYLIKDFEFRQKLVYDMNLNFNKKSLLKPGILSFWEIQSLNNKLYMLLFLHLYLSKLISGYAFEFIMTNIKPENRSYYSEGSVDGILQLPIHYIHGFYITIKNGINNNLKDGKLQLESHKLFDLLSCLNLSIKYQEIFESFADPLFVGICEWIRNENDLNIKKLSEIALNIISINNKKEYFFSNNRYFHILGLLNILGNIIPKPQNEQIYEKELNAPIFPIRRLKPFAALTHFQTRQLQIEFYGELGNKSISKDDSQVNILSIKKESIVSRDLIAQKDRTVTPFVSQKNFTQKTESGRHLVAFQSKQNVNTIGGLAKNRIGKVDLLLGSGKQILENNFESIDSKPPMLQFKDLRYINKEIPIIIA